MATPSIVVDVSGHGLGHLGQITPVIQALIARHREVRIVVRSTHAKSVVCAFVGANVEVDDPPPEATLVMRGPTVVDAAASAQAYRKLHGALDAHLDRETARLAKLEPDLLIADVPYLSIAAAKRLGVPAVALCSINWAEMYQAYCGEAAEAAGILDTIEAIYASADLFLQPQPHMPMLQLPNRRSTGPIARIGRNRQDEIRDSLRIPPAHAIVSVSLGGITVERRLELPEIPGVHWIFKTGDAVPPARATSVDKLGLPFIDVLASCDAVVTKVGY